MIYDLIIIGGGPGGTSAGVYAARKRLKTLFIAKEFGGQSTVSEGIQNWIGMISVPGTELARLFKAHLEAYKADVVDIKEGEQVIKLTKEGDFFDVTTDSGGAYQGKTVLITSGSHRRKLTIPGAKEFEQQGITYCASCDGPLFAGKDVVVVGGGNAAFETTVQLAAYCKSITIINRTDTFRADEVTVKRVSENPKVTIIKNADLVRIEGNKFVEKLIYKEMTTSEEKTLLVQGVFVEIGLIPSTEYVQGVVDLNKYNAIIVNPKNQQTSVRGIWAAGDCTDGLYHQNNIASGDAVKALEDIYQYLHAR